jgi:aminoglycoside phosphotransferase (APT) family kinase protein
MPLPSKRDLGALRERLQRWLGTVLPPDAAPRVSELSVPESSGFSSETLLFDATWQADGTERSGRYVVRMRPEMSDFPVFPDYDLSLQYRCLDLVRRHDAAPVPAAPWFEPDERHLGAPFFVMERIEGIAAPDMPPYTFGSWISEASVADRARLQEGVIAILARLHAIDLTDAEVAFLGRPAHGATPLAQHLGYQRWYYEWARDGTRHPLIERVFEWLDARHPPESGPPRLNWGDARIGNVLFRDFTPVAVLDWEMACLGAPEVDLAWGLVMHRFFADLATDLGMPGVPGFWERHDVVSAYERLAGRRVEHLEFYEVFAALRWGIISTRTSRRAIRDGQMPQPDEPDGLIMHRAMLERMLSGEYWR